MPAPSAEDAEGIRWKPIALAVGSAFGLQGWFATAAAQAFDPASPLVAQAYVAPLDPEKLEAARRGLNRLLSDLAKFPALLPKPPSGSTGAFGSSFSFEAIGLTGCCRIADPGYSPALLTAASDADLAILGNPVMLSNQLLQTTGTFGTARDFVIGPNSSGIEPLDGTFTISGKVLANAILYKSGPGTLALTGPNEWLANPIVLAGILKGPASSLRTEIANDAVVQFDQHSDDLHSFAIHGAGEVHKTGAATLRFSANHNYSGGTIIGQGRLALTGTSTLGSGPVAIAAGAALDLTEATGPRSVGTLSGSGSIVLGAYDLSVVSASSSQFAGVISGPGGIDKGGSGLLELTGANTYSGATTVAQGTLSLVAAGRLNRLSALRLNEDAVFDMRSADGAREVGSLSGRGTILLGVNGLTVGADNADTVYAGQLNGSGALNKVGTGTLTLGGDSLHTGTTTISQGTLLVRSTSLGPNVINNATLAFSESRSKVFVGEPDLPPGRIYSLYPELHVYSGDISGSGRVVKQGSGALWLRGTNSYAGGTIVEDGLLVGNDRSLRGNIVNDAGVVFYQAADGTYSGNISGSGMLLKYGPGNLTLSGVNTHSGGTGFSGLLTVARDANLGASGAAVIVAGGILRTTQPMVLARPFGIAADGATFDTGGNAVTVSGSISGPGALTKVGDGVLTLTGTNTYSGGTRVFTGRLAIEGTLASPVSVSPGAVLTGAGVVNANLALQPGSTLRVEVDSAGHASAIRAGSAQIEGAALTIDAQPGNYAARSTYTVLSTSGTVNGRFAHVSLNLPFLRPSIEYGPSRVGLTLVRNEASYRSVAQNATQAGIALALGTLVQSADPDARRIRDTLDALSESDARAAFDSLGGAGRASLIVAQQSGQRAVTQQAMARLSLADSVDGARGPVALSNVRLAFDESVRSDASSLQALLAGGAAVAEPYDSKRHGFWLRGFGGSGRIDGSDGFDDAETRFHGLVAGYDRALDERLRLGLLAAYTEPEISQDNPDARNEARSRQLAVYGRYRSGALRVDALAGLASSDIDGSRTVVAGALTRVASAQYGAKTAIAHLEAGYALGAAVMFEPVIGLEWSRQRNDSYTETGADAANLSEPARTIHSLRSSLGARVGRSWDSGGVRTTLEARALWMHEFRSPRSVSARFAGDPAATRFEVPAAAGDRNSAVLGAGIAVSRDDAFTFYADVNAELSASQRAAALGVGLRYRF